MSHNLPQLRTHIYWESKESFQLNKDIYETGVIFAVEQGSFRYEIGSEKGIAEFGEIVICPPHTSFHRETISPLSFHFMLFDFQNKMEPAIYTEMPSGKIHLSNKKRLDDNYNQLRNKDQIRPTLLTPFKQHIFTDLWFMVLHEQTTNMSHINLQPDDPLMIKAAEILQEKALEHFKIKDLAHQLELTQTQFTRRFHKAFRINPIEYITSIRLHKATTLLTETDHNLDQIAVDCGYESGFYLSRLFSKHMSMSPSDFRRRHRL
jgi:AraC family transcriptional regulator